MRKVKLICFVCFICVCHVRTVVGLDPISGMAAAAAALVSAVISNFEGLRGIFSETCTNKYLINNVTGLMPAINKRLYGQHLVLKAVSNHIRGHIKSAEPAKALALSFHGSTGTGKNYVSQLIAAHLYKKGLKSKYVHLVSATKEFPHAGMLPFYKDQLKNWIEGNVSTCAQSLFIFDEMDKMPHGLIDVIKPYLDYYDNLNGISYRKAIFIFLSNTAAGDITNYVLEHWNKGLPRDHIQLRDLEKVITTATVNSDKSGLWHSELITKHMITSFIPFLPLEKEHVRECIKDSLVAKGYYSNRHSIKQEDVDSVMKEMSFYPESEQVFSVTGCKRVSEKVDFVMADF